MRRLLHRHWKPSSAAKTPKVTRPGATRSLGEKCSKQRLSFFCLMKLLQNGLLLNIGYWWWNQTPKLDAPRRILTHQRHQTTSPAGKDTKRYITSSNWASTRSPDHLSQRLVTITITAFAMTSQRANVAIVGYGMSAKVFHIPLVLALPSDFKLYGILQRSPKDNDDASKDLSLIHI